MSFYHTSPEAKADQLIAKYGEDMAQQFAYERVSIHEEGTWAYDYWKRVSQLCNRVTYRGKPKSKAQKRRMRQSR